MQPIRDYFPKRLIQLNGIQMNNPIRKWTEDINTFIQRKHTDSQEAHEKKAPYH